MILIDSIWKTPMPCLLFNVFCYKHKVGFSIDSERKGKKCALYRVHIVVTVKTQLLIIIICLCERLITNQAKR